MKLQDSVGQKRSVGQSRGAKHINFTLRLGVIDQAAVDRALNRLALRALELRNSIYAEEEAKKRTAD